MKLLVFSSLWPNGENPTFGIFMRHRTEALARVPGMSLRVVAPIPWSPPVPRWLRVPERWRSARRVPRSETFAGLPVEHPRHLVTPRVGMSRYGGWMAQGAWDDVARLHHQEPFDAIDAHYVYPDGFAAVRFGRRLGIPTIVAAHGSDVNLYAQLPHIRPLLLRTLAAADGILAVSGELGDQIADLGVDPARVHVIRNGVRREIFHPVPRELARRRLGIDPEARAVLAVGALIPRKGMDLVIDAFAVAAARRPGVPLRLYIVGEGPERAALTDRIAARGLGGRALLLGDCPQEDLRNWYSATDVFCLASTREGCPNVVIEAMACGAPVVATGLGGVLELVRGRSFARLVDPSERSPAAWASAIEEMLAGKFDRERIAAHGAARTWDDVARETAEFYARVIARHSPPVLV